MEAREKVRQRESEGRNGDGGAGRWDGGSESREGGGKWYEGQAAPLSPGVLLLFPQWSQIYYHCYSVSHRPFILMFVSDLGSSRFQSVPVPG